MLDYLPRRRLLLVLDNLEHLLDEGGAAFPAKIARAAPGVAVLVTSRFRLHVAGERLYPVSGLDTPAEATAGGDVDAALAFSAVALFIEAARRVRPGFALPPDNVTAICRQVGGMPLAIEMAAAWLEALTLPEIAAEIQRGLDILATDLRDVPDRQRSIRAVCDASFRLLTEARRSLANLLVASGTGPADWIEAHELLREAAAAYERSGNTFALAFTLHELAQVGGHTLTAAERLAMLDRVAGLPDAPAAEWLEGVARHVAPLLATV